MSATQLHFFHRFVYVIWNDKIYVFKCETVTPISAKIIWKMPRALLCILNDDTKGSFNCMLFFFGIVF